MPSASENCLDFMSKLLDKVPTRRITADEAIKHNYISHLHDPQGEIVAKDPFPWEFDDFESTPRALKDRVYAECVRMHPELLERDAAWLKSRGFLQQTVKSASSAPAGNDPV